jgi:predicted short-subunit dehydrogenase-like oxidoreductase (DUF2520 family)
MAVAAPLGRCAVVGDGRMGRALTAALPWLEGPFGRGFDGHEFDVVLLAVPDGEIAAAAAVVAPGRVVGHCAGSLGLDALAPHEAFGVHPLMTVTAGTTDFAGAGAAIAGSTPRAEAIAAHFAEELGMHAVHIADADRAAYHAAASIASNFLVTLEDAAETMLRSVGADRSILVPLVRAALENWAAQGAPDALTGPIVRGDDATVARQRDAIAVRAPELLDMFDVMCERTRAIVERQRSGG